MEQNAYKAIQICGDAFIIEDGVVRMFLFIGEKEALLVDSGFGKSDLRGFIKTLTPLPVKLVNTHADHDHFGGNGQFESTMLHSAELERYESSGGGCPAAALEEGDVIDIGTRCFKVIQISGHTPGGIALLDEKNRVLIAGDNVQTGTIYNAGEGRDMHAYVEGLKKLRALSDRFDEVYPSHGPFPTEKSVIDMLISGSEQILSGKADGSTAPPPFDKIAKIYDIKTAKIVC